MGKSKRPLSGAALQARERKIRKQQQHAAEVEEETQAQETQAESSGNVQVERPHHPIGIKTEDIIPKAKSRIQGYQKNDSNDRTDKLLDDILDNLPLEGQKAFASTILEARNDEGLRELLETFKTKLLIPLKAKGGTTPTPSQIPSSSSSEKMEPEGSPTTLLPLAITKYASRSGQQKLKDCCLTRDGYKCVVSGVSDLNSEDQTPQDADTAITECSHIIPFSMAPSSKGKKPIESVSATWSIMYQCFPALKNVLDMNDPSRINDPRNAMTLLHDLHAALGSFSMAFEETENENVYTLKTYRSFPSAFKRAFLPKDGIVRFKSHDGNHIPLPDKAILAAHAAIARILHLTGMGEEIDKMLREFDKLSCLAEEGILDLPWEIRRWLFEVS
ncbi:hypothetical protein DTO021C3_8640 [Paecilomyces variotii]|nr:hypothetical protein DTO021C3_8640 [Paecilomyces variotii]KAJ9351683.1 hypothetical protein DTO027B9_6270 [Paecilomyces variotii]KAJ9410610.1 hypothetical protein DTO045G8_1516 [Paecilomyces variotii]